MDLRTRLVVSLVAVSLGSMFAFGAFLFSGGEALFTDRSELHLVSLADSKGELVEEVLDRWEDAVRLVASRTQLRTSLADWNRSRGDADQGRIAQILRDAQAASTLVDVVAAFDQGGRLVAQAGGNGVSPDAPPADGSRPGATFVGFTDEDPPRVLYAADLALEGEPIGTLLAVLSTAPLAAVARNVTGLGESGETLIAHRDPNGTVRLVTPLRHVSDGAADAPVNVALLARALDGEEGPVLEGLTDYRGQKVWAAMRRSSRGPLGLVLKIDEAEERADVVGLRDLMMGVGFSLSSVAVLIGILLGFGFAKPIHALATVADRIREGDMSARADESREDELGLLGQTFNEMSDELERRMKLLQDYKTFFDESRDMLCIAGTDGFFKQVNPSFEKTLGWSEEDLLGRPFVDFVHPDDVEATIRETQRLSQGIPTISFDNRYRCVDGSYKLLRWTSHPDPETGRLYASARHLPDPDEEESG